MVAFAPVPVISSRPLGSGEWLWWHMSRASSVNFVTLARLGGRVSVANLQQALLYIQHRYPILRSRITQQGRQRPRFEVLASVGVSLQVIPWLADTQWQDVAQSELAQGIAADAAPLWRATLIHHEAHSDLLLTFHHAMSDGLSSVHLVEELLSYHAGLRDEAPEQAILTPAYDQLLPKHPIWHTLKHYVTALRPLLRPAPAMQLPSTPVATMPPHASTSATANNSPDGAPHAYTQLYSHVFSPAQSAALQQYCQQSRHSMNDLLSGTLLWAAAPILAKHGSQQVAMTTAINVRPLLHASYRQAVGYYSTGIESRFLLAQNSDMGELGQQATALAKQQLNTMHLNFGLWLRQLLIRLKPDPHALIELLRQGSKASLHLSNLGRITTPSQYGELTLHRLTPIAGVHYTQKPLFCLMAVTFNQQLSLIACACQPMTGTDTATQMFKRVCQQLSMWADPSPSH